MPAAKSRSHARKSSTAIQMRSKFKFKPDRVKRGVKKCERIAMLCALYVVLGDNADFGLKGLPGFTTAAAATLQGRTNHDIRIVEAVLKTIVLCGGEGPRRGLAGQRSFSVDQPASAAVSTSVCISVTHTISIQHES